MCKKQFLSILLSLSFLSLLMGCAVILQRNAPPIADELRLPKTAWTTEDLTIYYLYSDADGDAETNSKIQWYKNGIVQSRYDNLRTLPAAATAKHDEWQFSVTPFDGTQEGITKVSTKVIIINTPPVAEQVKITLDRSNEARRLVVAYNYFDEDSDSEKQGEIQWFRNGELLPQYNNKPVIPASDVRWKDKWYYTLKPYDGKDYGSLVQSEVITINTPPSVSNLSITPSSPDSGDELHIQYIYHDDEAHPEAETETEIKWYKNDILQPTYNNQRILPAKATTKADEWHFSIKPSDGKDMGEVKISEKVIISNTPPIASNLSLVSNPGDEKQRLAVKYDYSDIDNDPEAQSEIHWYRNVQLLSQYDNKTAIPAADVRPKDKWYYVLKPYDGQDYGSLVQAEVLTINTPPTVSDIIVTPDFPGVKENIQIQYTYHDDEGDSEGDTEIKWYKNDILQHQYNNLSTLPSSATRAEERWHVTVRPHDRKEYGELQKSETILIRIPLNPQLTEEIEVAPYDINQVPIAVWVIEENDQKIGFIVTGHAELEVCQVASHQLFTTLLDIGYIPGDVFGAGIGFSIRDSSTPKFDSYSNKVHVMTRQFVDLEIALKGESEYALIAQEDRFEEFRRFLESFQQTEYDENIYHAAKRMGYIHIDNEWIDIKSYAINRIANIRGIKLELFSERETNVVNVDSSVKDEIREQCRRHRYIINDVARVVLRVHHKNWRDIIPKKAKVINPSGYHNLNVFGTFELYDEAADVVLLRFSGRGSSPSEVRIPTLNGIPIESAQSVADKEAARDMVRNAFSTVGNLNDFVSRKDLNWFINLQDRLEEWVDLGEEEYGRGSKPIQVKAEIQQRFEKDQVKVIRVDGKRYKATIDNILNHIKTYKDSSQNDTIVIEYHLPNEHGPILMPFHYIDKDEIVKFTVDEDVLGMPAKLPLGYARDLYDEAEAQLKAMQQNNDEVISRLHKILPSGTYEYKVYDLDKITTYRFSIYYVDLETGRQVDYPPPGASIRASSEVRHAQNQIIKTALNANSNIWKELWRLGILRQKALNAEMVNTSVIVDSFLRGWRLSFGKEQNNQLFDSWVEERRVKVWNQLLNEPQFSGLQRNNRLAGIFHEENVVFNVIRKGKKFEITPYYVLGGNFSLVLDQGIGVCQFISPYTRRK